MKRLFVALVLLFGTLRAAAAVEVVVVVAADAGVAALNREQVINIFMGRYRRLPTGLEATPYDLPGDDVVKAAFYAALLGKNLSEVNAYWARLIFSGRTAPPVQATDVADMLRRVAAAPGAVGYLPRSAVNDRVRVVYALQAP